MTYPILLGKGMSQGRSFLESEAYILGCELFTIPKLALKAAGFV
jgi:hypothetical protein